MPITVIAGCCARAASGHVAAAPPSRAMNVRLLMSDMGIPPLRLPLYHETASGFLGAVLNRYKSRSSLRSLRRLLEAARNRLWEFLSLPNCALEVLIHAWWHGLVVLISNVFAYHFEYRKRSPQMRQCHWSWAKMYGRHSELFGLSLGSGILIIRSISRPQRYGPHSPKDDAATAPEVLKAPTLLVLSFGYRETQRFKPRNAPPRVPARSCALPGH